ncbi:MAG: DNA-binding transcriptional regulator OxyR [Bdellovibrio sp. CG12_big_fil_rev_8_21_14_0_65_39_13]|nr:MAG: DNA-binding transcriptional regulator OxyR [Bdellovibrio sp. CG22_combo_CG10-13_8_21_14_all_39_27]PIQ58786.1 MAG: DNA-binding transcriptional regulator OxyR [Bdellovibrio sp. CG12_big_fil_rev_8_21_14_0_65_39_13]PIR35533.1 MAG: DNA-binding transcriptional regulator OxyR [Bdellovibrio sp. CG11_big_fil_rev_8_21_14_0_20_39_38]PJB52915.1 MAG: DNA-binding transcriptional regulator OxyR [Bdellovibrio sp. CG_4_9_14_3_um_filter_39_7]
MSLSQIEYALAVNRFRNFKKAADYCHVTQPTLSMQLQKFEEQIGIILFDRSKSPTVPTLEGERVLEQAQIVIRDYHKMLELARGSDQQVEGDFHLAVIPTMAPYVVPLFVGKFMVDFPKVNLIITEMQTEVIIEALDRDEIDAGLMATPLKRDNLIEKVLFYEPFMLFLSPLHALLKKTKIKDNDLVPEEIWLLSEGHCFRNQVLSVCDLRVPKSKKVGVSFESGNLETLKQMVMKSGGYTLLPQLATDQLSTAAKKQLRPFQAPIPTREVSLVYSRSFLKEKIVNALEKTIIEALPIEMRNLKGKQFDVVPID